MRSRDTGDGCGDVGRWLAGLARVADLSYVSSRGGDVMYHVPYLSGFKALPI
jgi:hypothetical protein